MKIKKGVEFKRASEEGFNLEGNKYLNQIKS